MEVEVVAAAIGVVAAATTTTLEVEEAEEEGALEAEEEEEDDTAAVAAASGFDFGEGGGTGCCFMLETRDLTADDNSDSPCAGRACEVMRGFVAGAIYVVLAAAV